MELMPSGNKFDYLWQNISVMKIFQKIPFKIEDKYDCDPDAINTALQEGTRYLDNQVSSIEGARRHASMLVTVLSAIIAALIGILLTRPETTPYCISLIGLSLIPMFILILGLFFRRTVYHSGDSPSHYMETESVKWTREMKGFTELKQDALLKLMHLEEIQFRIMQNEKLQESLVRYYRLALLLMLTTYSAAFVVIAVLQIICA